MILAVHDRVHIYSSPDLLDWRFESEFGNGIGAHGGVWECPDLFELKVTGSDISRWVMFVSINPGGPDGGSATQYFTGEFDGHKFVPDNTNEKWVDSGRDNYAGVTWSNVPESDGRRLFIGWMSNWDYATVVPTAVWRSATTVPRELSLFTKGKEYSLLSNPVQELVSLRKNVYKPFREPQKYSGEMEIITDSISLMQCEMIIEFSMIESESDSIGIILENNLNEQLVIGFAGNQKKIFVDRTKAGRSAFSEKFAGISSSEYEAGDSLKFRILMDASSSELFVDNGKLVMTNIVFPTESYTKLKAFSNSEATLKNVVFYSLKSIWQK